MVTLMAVAGLAAGTGVFGAIGVAARRSLKRSKLVADDLLAEHYRSKEMNDV